MRIEIAEKGVGGRDEHWWYLVFDEIKGDFSIEYEWDYAGWGKSDRGTEALSLSEAKEQWPDKYKKAVELITRKLFN